MIDAEHPDRRSAPHAAAPDRPRRSRRSTRAGSTRRTRRSDDEKLPKRRPEPCVAVATAPAMCCATMSPWFASASPAAQSGSPNSPIVVAGPTTTRRRSASVERMPRQRAQVEQQAVGADDRRERVAGPRDTHAEPARRGAGDQLGDLVLARRRRDLGRGARLVADPVRPRHQGSILAGRPKSGKSASVSRKNVNSRICLSDSSTTCSAQGS